MAPFYDLLSVAAYDTLAFDKKGWPTHTELAWPILGVRHFSAITRKLMLEAGAALKLTKTTSERLLENLRSRIFREAKTLYAEIEAENEQMISVRPDLSATIAGESRCLRTILHTVIHEMTRQVA